VAIGIAVASQDVDESRADSRHDRSKARCAPTQVLRDGEGIDIGRRESTQLTQRCDVRNYAGTEVRLRSLRELRRDSLRLDE
jgi:hypothetical protein